MSENTVITSSTSIGVVDANRKFLIDSGYAKWINAATNSIEIDLVKVLVDLVQATKIKAK